MTETALQLVCQIRFNFEFQLRRKHISWWKKEEAKQHCLKLSFSSLSWNLIIVCRIKTGDFMQLNALSVGPTYVASAVIQSLAAGIRSVLQYLYNTC